MRVTSKQLEVFFTGVALDDEHERQIARFQRQSLAAAQTQRGWVLHKRWCHYLEGLTDREREAAWKRVAALVVTENSEGEIHGSAGIDGEAAN